MTLMTRAHRHTSHKVIVLYTVGHITGAPVFPVTTVDMVQFHRSGLE